MLAMAIVAGCTDLAVSRLPPIPEGQAANKEPAPASGMAYALPYAQYTITLTRRVTDCTASGVTIDTNATATVAAVPDPAHSYLIDPSSLSSWFKASDLSATTYPSGALKTVGLSSEDKLGPILVNTVTGLIHLAEAALGFAGGTPAVPTGNYGAAGGGPISPAAACSPAIQASLKRLPALKRFLAAANTAMEAATAKLNGVKAVAALLGQQPDAASQRLIVNLALDLAHATAAFDQATARLTTELAIVTEKQVVPWPEDGATLRAADFNSLLPATIGKWQVDAAKAHAQTVVSVALVPARGAARLYTSTATVVLDGDDALRPSAGLRYRIPVTGSLVICHGADCLGGNGVEQPQPLASGPTPQLGRLLMLPFHNGPFQSNVLNVSFAEDGTLTSYGYTEKAARGEVASDTFNKIAALLQPAPKDFASARNASTEAKTEQIKDQTALFQADADLYTAIKARQNAATALTAAPNPASN